MTTIGNKILLFGGTSKTPDETKKYSDAFVFDTKSFQWSVLPQNGDSDAIVLHARDLHAMVSIENKVFLFGDYDRMSNNEDSMLELVFGRVHTWPTLGASSFTKIYDGDIIVVDKDVQWDWNSKIDLCSLPFLPCSLTIQVDLNANFGIYRHSYGVLSCDSAIGCTGISLRGVDLSCNNKIVASLGPLQVLGEGAVLSLEKSSISNCHAITDGGGIRAYNGARVIISGCAFRRSSSQVIVVHFV